MTATVAPSESAVATWVLDGSWPVFAGHFPAHPVLPGALLLDWVVSNTEIQVGASVESVVQVKFSLGAEPGDCLTLKLRQDRVRVRFEVSALRQDNQYTVASGVLDLRTTTPPPQSAIHGPSA